MSELDPFNLLEQDIMVYLLVFVCSEIDTIPIFNSLKNELILQVDVAYARCYNPNVRAYACICVKRGQDSLLLLIC